MSIVKTLTKSMLFSQLMLCNYTPNGGDFLDNDGARK